MSNYFDTLQQVKRCQEEGDSVYDMCIAYELDLEINEAIRKLNYSKVAKQMFHKDEEKLFEIAVKGLSSTYGASSPKDIVGAVVEAYLDGGYSLVRARSALGDVQFVLKMAENEVFTPEKEVFTPEKERKQGQDVLSRILPPIVKCTSR